MEQEGNRECNEIRYKPWILLSTEDSLLSNSAKNWKTVSTEAGNFRTNTLKVMVIKKSYELLVGAHEGRFPFQAQHHRMAKTHGTKFKTDLMRKFSTQTFLVQNTCFRILAMFFILYGHFYSCYPHYKTVDSLNKEQLRKYNIL